jgi:antagonist of KipI
MNAALILVKPSPLTTVQDLGRPGWERFGVSPSGAMDPLAARVANAMVGNPPTAPLLEVTGAGAVIELEEARLVAMCGADLGAEVGAPGGAKPLPPFTAARLEAGERLCLRARRRGARAYLAVAGGLDARRSFGSAASDLAGGLGGSPLRASDRVPLGRVEGEPPAGTDLGALVRWYEDPGRLRFVPAPAAPAGALSALASADYVVSPRSNRTGYQLDGPTLHMHAEATELSEPIAPGAIQVPPDGRAILLMADRQTVGGYPVIGFLAGVDVPKAAQLWPGDRIRLAAISLDEAQAALRAQRADLDRLCPAALR